MMNIRPFQPASSPILLGFGQRATLAAGGHGDSRPVVASGSAATRLAAYYGHSTSSSIVDKAACTGRPATRRASGRPTKSLSINHMASGIVQSAGAPANWPSQAEQVSSASRVNAGSGQVHLEANYDFKSSASACQALPGLVSSCQRVSHSPLPTQS